MMLKNEKGAALPLVLIAIALGALVIPSFLSHAGASLISSRAYEQEMNARYAADSGAEHAIWNLRYGGLADTLADVGDNITYPLEEAVNGLAVTVTVIKTGQPDGFGITASAGDRELNAAVSVNAGAAGILSWSID